MKLQVAAKGDDLEAFYLMALTTGARLGELQALKWNALDLAGRHVQIVATYQGMKDGEPVFGERKTAGSRRNVRLSTVVTESMRRHKAAQLEKRLLVGQHWQDYGLVFSTSTGRPLDGNNLRTRSFARLLTRAGLPPMRFHALRHAAATLLMAEGVPIKVISEVLGHSDVTTTLRIYAHALPTAQDQAAAVWDRLYGGAV
jgi:integrase